MMGCSKHGCNAGPRESDRGILGYRGDIAAFKLELFVTVRVFFYFFLFQRNWPMGLDRIKHAPQDREGVDASRRLRDSSLSAHVSPWFGQPFFFLSFLLLLLKNRKTINPLVSGNRTAEPLKRHSRNRGIPKVGC